MSKAFLGFGAAVDVHGTDDYPTGMITPARLLAFSVLFSTAHAADWPHYRGAAHNGSSPEKVAPFQSGGPRELWRIQLGTGLSSVTVADARAYSTGYKEGSDISKVAGLAALKRYDEALTAFDPSWIVSTRADYLLFHPIFDPMREDRRWQKFIATRLRSSSLRK